MGTAGTILAVVRDDWWVVIACAAALVVGTVVGATVSPKGGARARARLHAAFTTPIRDRSPGFFFVWNLGTLLVLLALPMAYANNVGHVRDAFTDPIADVIPIGVPLAGAIGAVTISLYGIFRYNAPEKWDKSLAYWHLARPVMGAVLGSFGFLMFIGVVQATGADPTIAPTVGKTATTLAVDAEVELDDEDAIPAEAPATDDPDGTAAERQHLILYYVVAFVVGFREQSFRELIKKVSDVLIKPSGSDEDGDDTSGGESPPPTNPPIASDDLLDGTGVDYTADPVADDDLATVVLAPDGDPEKLAAYAALFEETS